MMSEKSGNNSDKSMFVVKTNKLYRINGNIMIATLVMGILFMAFGLITMFYELRRDITVESIFVMLLFGIGGPITIVVFFKLMVKELHQRFDLFIFDEDGIQINSIWGKKYRYAVEDIKHVKFDNRYCMYKGMYTEAMFLCFDGEQKYEFPIYKEVHDDYNRAHIWMNQHNIEVIKKDDSVSDYAIPEFKRCKEIRITKPQIRKKDYRSCEMKSKGVFSGLRIDIKYFIKAVPIFFFVVLSPMMLMRTTKSLSRLFYLDDIVEMLIALVIGIGIPFIIYIFFKSITRKKVCLEQNMISIRRGIFIKKFKLEDVKHIQYDENKQFTIVKSGNQLRFDVNGKQYRFNDCDYDNFGNFVSFLMKRAEVELIP